MKRKIAYAALAAIVLTSAQPALASESSSAATVSESLDNSFVETDELKSVAELDLDTALSLATEDSVNLGLLELKYKALEAKQKDLEKQEEDLETTDQNIYLLPDTPEELMEQYNLSAEEAASQLWLGPAIETNTVVNQVTAGMNGLSEGMNELILSQRNQAKVAAKQMENDKWNTELDQAEAKEGITLQMTAEYVQLLAQQKQLALAEQYAGVLESDLARAQKLEAAGLSSEDDIDELENSIATQNEQIQTLKNKYTLGLVQLSFDLGIAYNPDLVLKDIDYDVPASAERLDTETILASSFEMKRLYNDINQAEWEQKYTSTSNNYGDNYLAVNVKIAEQQAEQAKIDLGKQIEAVYTSADNAYQSYASQLRISEQGQSDHEKMKARYKAGLISKHDLTKFEFQLAQNDTKTEVAKLQAFVASRQIAAMENGFIQTSE